jgi:hypothetical protein
MRARLLAGVMSLTLAPLAAQTPSRGAFVDRTAETGFDFVHANGARGQLLLPEVIGSGGALLDYDNDGDLDVFASPCRALRMLLPPRAAAACIATN